MRDEENGASDTLRAMHEVLGSATARRRCLVFSGQSDSRAKPRKRQRDAGGLAGRLCDFAVSVGDHARHARRAALDAGMDPAGFPHVVRLQDTAAWPRDSLGPGDLVFLEARATDHLSRILFAQVGEIACWRSTCEIRRPCDDCSQLGARFDPQAVLVDPGDLGQAGWTSRRIPRPRSGSAS